MARELAGERSKAKGADLDLGLAVLCALREEDQTFTQDDIAEVCGVSQSMVYYLEKRARRKLANALLRPSMGEVREALASRR